MLFMGSAMQWLVAGLGINLEIYTVSKVDHPGFRQPGVHQAEQGEQLEGADEPPRGDP